MQPIDNDLRGLPPLRFQRDYYLPGSRSWNQLTKQILLNDFSQPQINQAWSIATKARRRKKRSSSYRTVRDIPYNLRIRRQSCHCHECGNMSSKQKFLMKRGVPKDIKQHKRLKQQYQSIQRELAKMKAKSALKKHAKTIIAVSFWKTKNTKNERQPLKRNTVISNINKFQSKSMIAKESIEKSQSVKSLQMTIAQLLHIRKPSKDVQKYLDSKSTSISQYEKPIIPKLKLAPLQEKYHPYLHRKSISNKFF